MLDSQGVRGATLLCGRTGVNPDGRILVRLAYHQHLATAAGASRPSSRNLSIRDPRPPRRAVAALSGNTRITTAALAGRP
jgi:hypothetical protein